MLGFDTITSGLELILVFFLKAENECGIHHVHQGVLQVFHISEKNLDQKSKLTFP
jgi:hypothetical protein